MEEPPQIIRRRLLSWVLAGLVLVPLIIFVTRALMSQFLTRPMVLMMLASKGSGIRIETYFPWLINLDSNPSQPRQDMLSTLEKIYRLSFLYFKSFLSCQLL
ncbi:unnamed protein product [Arabidopsis halleri]